MITFQDLSKVSGNDSELIKFVMNAIHEHMHSDKYLIALDAQSYDRRQNTTILNYRKLLYTVSGVAVPDNYSANYKLCSNFFQKFIIQQNQYLLGNGVTWGEDSTKDKLGKDFDTRLQELGHYALVDGVSFGFWNYNHLEVFRLTEFVPLYDEEDGAMKAGIRFWQIDKKKPLRATLYELDGYTDYIWRPGEEGRILNAKRPYKLIVRTSAADGEEIYDYENYPSFPIIPLWANPMHQSELIGIKESIDSYDLIKSGFANDLDDASQIYWVIHNAGGMDDVDLAKFIKRMKTVKAATVDDDGARAESHSIEVPYASRETLLTRLRNDLYDDFMALDTKIITGGAATATQIRAAYEPLNGKTDMYEYCVHDFIDGLLFVAGIEDEATFTRSVIINTQEEIQVLLQAAQYLSDDYVTEKIITIFGDIDRKSDILEEMDEENIDRMPIGQQEIVPQEQEEVINE